jgi:hypothetical protein
VAFFVWVVSVVGIYVKKTCSMGCNFVIFIYLICFVMYVLRWWTRETGVIVYSIVYV